MNLPTFPQSGLSRAVVAVLLGCAFVAARDRATVPVAAGTLVSYESLGDSCVMPAAFQPPALGAAAHPGVSGEAAAAATPFMDPIRKIKDPYPSFAAVTVDPARNEVIFTDESLFQVLVYDRLENTSDGAQVSKPRRLIAGEKTNIEFQSGVWLDGKTGEIYAVNNDTRDTTVIFGGGANGDATPVRSIKTPHGTFGIAVAEGHNELMLTTQHDSSIVTYRKNAGGEESPIRFLQGNKTKLADPHGIVYDAREDVVFVANFGSVHDVDAKRPPRPGVPSAGGDEGKQNWPLGRELSVPGSGTISPASISVHRRVAAGNEAAIRVIQGSATQLNWPTGLAFDSNRRELYVANDMGPSILVFDANATGNAAPKRVLKGARTGLANPTSIALDLQNNELWVANFGGHTGTVYDLTASGDTPPKRTIRNAPAGKPSLMIGNPGAVAYDSKRENILVPN